MIVKQDGSVLYFFHSKTDGLCMKTKTGRHWAEPVILLADAYHDFDTLLDNNQNIHIICQDLSGNILHLIGHDAEWRKYTLLLAKTKGAYEKNFHLVATGSRIQLFYTIHSTSADKLLLIHMMLGSEYEPVVVDSLKQQEHPFFAVCDDYMNTYIYYQNLRGQLGCRIFAWSKKEFSPFQECQCPQACQPFVYIDSFGRHHICALQDNDIVYFQMNPDGEYTPSQRITKDSPFARTLPIAFCEQEKTYIMWMQQAGIFYCMCSGGSHDFSPPARFYANAKQLLFIKTQNGTQTGWHFGYLDSSDLHLFGVAATSRNSYTGQTAAMPNRVFRPQGSDAQQFSQRHIHEFGEEAAAKASIRSTASQMPPAENLDQIELSKIKIMLTALNNQLSELNRKYQSLQSQVSDLKQSSSQSDSCKPANDEPQS